MCPNPAGVGRQPPHLLSGVTGRWASGAHSGPARSVRVTSPRKGMWDEDAMLGLERGFLSRGAGRQCSRSVQRAEGPALGRGGGAAGSSRAWTGPATRGLDPAPASVPPVATTGGSRVPRRISPFRLSYLKVLSYQIITTTTTLMKRNMVTSMPGQGREGTSLATGLGSGFNVRCRPASVTCAVSHVHLFTPYCIAFYN